jgi:hypothetical protein
VLVEIPKNYNGWEKVVDDFSFLLSHHETGGDEKVNVLIYATACRSLTLTSRINLPRDTMKETFEGSHGGKKVTQEFARGCGSV